MMRNFILVLFYTTTLMAQYPEWGWDSHKFINENAVDFLPQEMAYFKNYKTYLKDHSVDPDMDNNPGYYHYIDIDYYPDFFNGTLPHQWDDFVAMYGYSTAVDNGIVPWVIEDWTDSLTSLLSQGNWNEAMQIAAELGHYIADSHQPLHLTLNYNGYSTGNNGIHSRYESTMMSGRLNLINLPSGQASYWHSPIDSVFGYIEFAYPFVDSIMAADDIAKAQDPFYGSTYYSLLWQNTRHFTNAVMQKAILHLASVWYTAWVDAGSPNTTQIGTVNSHQPSAFTMNVFPNPFNPLVNIELEINKSQYYQISIHNMQGQKIKTIFNGKMPNGLIKHTWDGSNELNQPVSSGTYLLSISSDTYFDSRKIVYLK